MKTTTLLPKTAVLATALALCIAQSAQSSPGCEPQQGFMPEAKDGHRVTIVCDTTVKAGVASAYTSHTFSLDAGDAQLSSHKWTCLLPLAGGGDEAVAGSTGETMTLMPIDDASRYFHTADNCINAAIGFTGRRPDGTECTASLGIRLDLKPLITQAGIVSITPCGYDTTYYDVEVEVHYAGSRYVHVDVEQEHMPYVLTDFSDSPHYSMFKFTDIDSWGYARINISVKNDYGTDTAVIEIPRRNHPASVDEVLGDGNHTVEAYTASGQYLGRMHSIDELRATSERLLILRIYDNATDVVRTVKYICR